VCLESLGDCVRCASARIRETSRLFTLVSGKCLRGERPGDVNPFTEVPLVGIVDPGVHSEEKF
jgi:hypothetical protein